MTATFPVGQDASSLKVESTPETQHQAEFFCQSWMSFGSTRDCCGSKTMVQNQETLTK